MLRFTPDCVECRFPAPEAIHEASESTEPIDVMRLERMLGLMGVSLRKLLGWSASAMVTSSGTATGVDVLPLLRAAAAAAAVVTSGDGSLESGGDMGISGRSSLNLLCVRTGVPDFLRGVCA